jgi:metallo-beta-lactamase class B
MNKLFFLAIYVLIQLPAFSQPEYKAIKISNDIELIKISDNAFIHVSYFETKTYGRVGANGLIFINGNKAFLFDSPWNDALTKDLVSWLTDSMKTEVVGFIPNHWHEDCMGGLGYLQSQKIESYANQMTIDIAKSNNIAVPGHGFKDSLQLQLGDKLISCYYFGAAHTVDNIVVWIPSEQILFAGCMIKSANSKDLGNTADGDLAAYPETIGKLAARFPMAKIVIPGHGDFGGFELVKHTKDLLSE